MLFIIVKIIHILAAFTYGGFLIVDNLFLVKMPQTLDKDEHTKAREAIMMHVRKVVPWALIVAVVAGIFLITQVFGEVSEDGLSRFQILLSIKAFLGLWLGIRGFNQKFFGINPFVFKSHILPFSFVIAIIILSQLIYI